MQLLDQTRPLGRDADAPALGKTLPDPLQADFKAQQQHLQQLVVSLDSALSSLVPVQQSPSKVPHRASTAPPRQSRSGRDRIGKVGRGPSHAVSSKDAQAITPESATALAAEALAAVKLSLVLTQHDSGSDIFSSGRRRGQQQQQQQWQAELDGAKELRSALARAIGALRNACVDAASSTAELLGGQDPTGFAEEVRALANAHEKELEQAMAEEGLVLKPRFPVGLTTAVAGDDGLADAAREKDDGGPGVGLEFWSRQSDLWSGVFAEQQTGLLQMVRAQEAELRQGKRRVSSLEKELSALNDKRKEMAATALEAKEREHRGRTLGEEEADEWRQRLDRMRADYERRAVALGDRESAVAAAEARVESRARELGTERDRLKTGAMALSAEADGLRWVCTIRSVPLLAARSHSGAMLWACRILPSRRDSSFRPFCRFRRFGWFRSFSFFPPFSSLC